MTNALRALILASEHERFSFGDFEEFRACVRMFPLRLLPNLLSVMPASDNSPPDYRNISSPVLGKSTAAKKRSLFMPSQLLLGFSRSPLNLPYDFLVTW
jgi:hypothetical protein